MAGLRIRWPGRSAAPASEAATYEAPSEAMLGAFVWLALGLILALALAARVYNVDWDENTHLHPDERFLTIVASEIKLPDSLSQYFDTDRSRLNPANLPNTGSFVYGTLPLFMTKAVAVALGQDDYNHIVL